MKCPWRLWIQLPPAPVPWHELLGLIRYLSFKVQVGRWVTGRPNQEETGKAWVTNVKTSNPTQVYTFWVCFCWFIMVYGNRLPVDSGVCSCEQLVSSCLNGPNIHSLSHSSGASSFTSWRPPREGVLSKCSVTQRMAVSPGVLFQGGSWRRVVVTFISVLMLPPVHKEGAGGSGVQGLYSLAAA